MIYKKILLRLSVLPLVLFLAVSSAAQETCALNVENAPALFGLKLAQSPEEVQAVFGRALKIKIKKKGEKIFFQNFIKKPAPSVLAGVRALYLRFLDRRLYQIEIFYEDRPQIETLEDFEANLSETLNLPDALWQRVKGKAVINCGELTIVADKLLTPHVELTDEPTRRKALELREPKK